MSNPARSYRDYSREELLEVIRRLEAEAKRREEEMDAIEDALAVPRSCTDPRCSLCAACVDAIFRKAHPLPLTIPQKYVASPWRKP